MGKTTVTEKIGDEYMQWSPCSKIFISAPTGSGKTYFVLHKLLPYVVQKNQRILYLVNRTILKEQLEREISLLPFDLTRSIEIVLYQTIENYILYNNGNELGKLVNGFDYVICDECHYFLADSNYNTNTCLSFQWVRDWFYTKVRVFMSATIGEMKECIESEEKNARHKRTELYKVYPENAGSPYAFSNSSFEYILERCYDYLNVVIITSRDRVIDLVCDGNEKWLIFVDSIPFGKELCKKVKKKFRELSKIQNEADEGYKEYKRDVVFLSSGYKREGGEAAEEAQTIRNDNVQSARVLIATSVLDNGINLKDDRLNNVIIFADNETEFIQMLGRKREDGNKVNLYIFKREKEHFDRRLDQLRRKGEVVSDYLKRLNEADIIEKAPLGQGTSLEKLNESERKFVYWQHVLLLHRLLNEENIYDKIRMAFYAKEGLLLLNPLSVRNMDMLKEFYNNIIAKFERGEEDAFVREQLRWLGKGEKEIEEMIAQSKITEETRIRQKVCDMINNIIDDQMTKAEAIDFKNRIKDKLLLLVRFCQDSDEKDIVEKSLKKNDRPISDKNMEFLHKNCNLPYKVETVTDGEGKYVFRCIGS